MLSSTAKGARRDMVAIPLVPVDAYLAAGDRYLAGIGTGPSYSHAFLESIWALRSPGSPLSLDPCKRKVRWLKPFNLNKYIPALTTDRNKDMKKAADAIALECLKVAIRLCAEKTCKYERDNKSYNVACSPVVPDTFLTVVAENVLKHMKQKADYWSNAAWVPLFGPTWFTQGFNKPNYVSAGWAWCECRGYARRSKPTPLPPDLT